MSDHHQHTEFLKQSLRYDESDRCKELEREIIQIQRDERCVRRAAWLMAVLTALTMAGLVYPGILMANFPYSAPLFLVNLVCALGLGSFVSFLAFVGLGVVYRQRLDHRREECRQRVSRLLETRLGHPRPAPGREGPADDGSCGALQSAAPGNGAPTGFESAAPG
jgi:hypothetical protein